MPAHDAAGRAATKPRTTHILLVEDNPGDARLILELLAEAERAVYRTEHVRTLDEGLARLRGGAVDLALVDLGLPDSHGIETAVRMLEAARETPVIVLTGLDDEPTGMLAVQEGAQDYLVKGEVTADLLLRAIQHAIQRQDLVRHLERALKNARAMEANLRNVLALSPDGVLVVGDAGEVRYANAAAETLYGCTARELVGETTELPWQEDGPRRAQLLARDGRRLPVEVRSVEAAWAGAPARFLWLRPLEGALLGG